MKFDRRLLIRAGLAGSIGYLLSPLAFAQEQESREDLVARTLREFPATIPGAGRIEKLPVDGARYLVIRIDQLRMQTNLHVAQQPIAQRRTIQSLRDETDRIAHVQDNIAEILTYLCEHDRGYFPHRETGANPPSKEQFIYYQSVGVIEALNFEESSFDDDALVTLLQSTPTQKPTPRDPAEIQRGNELYDFGTEVRHRDPALLAVNRLRTHCHLALRMTSQFPPEEVTHHHDDIPVWVMVYATRSGVDDILSATEQPTPPTENNPNQSSGNEAPPHNYSSILITPTRMLPARKPGDNRPRPG